MDIVVSFIVPVYNVSKYLNRCLDSLAAQANQGIEVIMVDDGSTDDSGAICEEYAKKYSNFYVYHQKNKGIPGARNTGLSYAKGEWICFVDSDDYIESDFMKNVSLDKYSEYDIIYFGFSRVDESGNITKMPIWENSMVLSREKSKLLGCIILHPDIMADSGIFPSGYQFTTAWGKLFKHAFLTDNDIMFQESVRRSEDVIFSFEVFLKKPVCYLEKQYLYFYQYNQSSITTKYNPDISKQYEILYNKIMVAIDNSDEKDVYLVHLPYRAVRNFMFCCNQDFCHAQNKDSYKKRRESFLKLRQLPLYDKAFKDAKMRELKLGVRAGAILCKYKQFFLYSVLFRVYRSVIKV